MTDVVVARRYIQSPVSQELIDELNAEVMELYPEEGTEESFALEPHQLAPDRGAFLVALLDGEAVGCGAARRIAGGVAEIKRMYVRPAARRRGAAGAVLSALEAEARRPGAARLVLETAPREQAAIALYRREGFDACSPYGDHEEHPLSVNLAKNL